MEFGVAFECLLVTAFPESGLLSEFEILTLECIEVGLELGKLRTQLTKDELSVVASGEGQQGLKQLVHDQGSVATQVKCARPTPQTASA